MEQAGCPPIISVIVPVYNVVPYLKRCVDSILGQNRSFFELILVDDGSTDGSSDLCDALAATDDRIRIIHKANGGLSDARNTGIANCSGDYITFIDSDDWVAPQYLDALYSLLISCDADMSSCGMIRASEPTPFVDTPPMPQHATFSSSEYLDFYFRKRGNRTVHYAWGKLYKRELLTNDQFPVGMLNEDVESMFFVLTRSLTIVETDAPLYYYFINHSSITGSSFGENYLNLTTVWEHLDRRAERECPGYATYRDDIRYNIARSHFTILVDSIVHGNKKTDEIYSKAIQANRQELRGNLGTLLAGPMRIDRKIMCVAVCFAYRPIRGLFRLGRRLKPKRG